MFTPPNSMLCHIVKAIGQHAPSFPRQLGKYKQATALQQSINNIHKHKYCIYA